MYTYVGIQVYVLYIADYVYEYVRVHEYENVCMNLRLHRVFKVLLILRCIQITNTHSVKFNSAGDATEQCVVMTN